MTNLSDLSYNHREHVKKLVDWLLSEIGLAGGDGDAAWVVQHLDILKLRNFIQDECLNNKDQRYWALSDIKENAHGRHFTLSHHQECLLITTSEKDVPSWSQCTVVA